MKTAAALLVSAMAVAGIASASPPNEPAASAWPTVTQTAKPWMRWWWPGSAVEPAQLTRTLEEFAKAGIGGVEITPIYGARGAEARYIDYLSPRWVQMLAHTAREAKRLGLGVDMATGTGWPFGGPGVNAADGSSSLQLVDGQLAGEPTRMQVKRPAPGGEGLVLDPYSTDALDRYLQPFTRALASLPRGALRSQFHDSFEYYGASWSPGLAAQFREMHGYDIEKYAAELAGARPMDADTLGRIKGDYRRTLATMHLEYVRRWVSWSHEHGFIARNQAHGSPGRLLDLYGASDVPETESFGTTVLPIPGLRQDANDIRDDPDPPINLIGRFASSAAHVNGRALASSETLTWLRENYRESPSQAKPQLDRLFIAGIDHIFYHGSTYSPADAAWPGWFFYAATQLNPTNPLWQDFTAMHAYVARVQSVLQQGRPDNDVLVYWPEADEQDDAAGLMRQHGMHENQWLVDSPAGRLARKALESGYSLDFISDAQLQALTVDGGNLLSPGARYRVLVVPATRRMPLETLAALVRLRKSGAQVRIQQLPEDVPGLGRLPDRRAEFRRMISSAELSQAVVVDEAQAFSQVRREPAADLGLWFTRRARADGFDYLLVNPGAKRFDAWLPLATPARRADLLDPLTGEAGAAAVSAASGKPSAVYLQLDAGVSMILRTYGSGTKRALAPWRYFDDMQPGTGLSGGGSLEFLRGGPELPAKAAVEEPGSWTALDDPRATRFSGTARYRMEFVAPSVVADDWQLDLGDVRETARVTLNGQFLGTVWSLPSRIKVGTAMKPGVNLLEIEVTNLPANRVRDLDQRKVDWKIMKDINLASLRYKSLDASGWEPQPSGLLGPMRLVPLKSLSPARP
ncbi:MAG TPA: glycosyl hydrolase [Steroidobacteraceae bacterium]|nr:glycosyl hydrolase [Steroidobacteraceae bacterium]